jgi:GNAT superfamily N-acetyltransferase
MTDVQWEEWRIDAIDDAGLPLVKHFYKTWGISFKHTEGECIFVLRGVHGETVSPVMAAVRYQPVGNCFLLRSLCVEPASRRRGLARKLLELSLESLHFPCCYSFALSHLRDLYSSFSFKSVAFSEAPEAVAKAYINYRRHRRNLLLMKYGG